MINELSKATKQLLFKEPFYGLILMALNKSETEQIPTAAVSKNGIDMQLSINPTFYTGIDETTRIAVLKHELLHVCFMHLLLTDKMPDRELMNIAADLEVNQYINAEYKTGKSWKELGPVEIENYPELQLPLKAGVLKYYELLGNVLQRRKNQQGQSGQQGQQGQGQGQQGQGQQGEEQEGEGEGQGQGQGKKGKQPQSGQGQGQGQGGGFKGDKQTQSKIWDYYNDPKQSNHLAGHELWKEFTKDMSEAEKKLLEKQIQGNIKRISEQVQKSRGTIPSELKEMIDNLFKVEEPVIDWKGYLRKFAGNSNKIYTKKSRRKPNKRYPDNPAIKVKMKRHILVGRDTSGSTSHADHVEFFNELHHIYKAGVKITVADSDASVADIFEYTGKTPDHLTGRGGTDFDPVIQYYNDNYKKYDTLIYLTDGICSAPQTKPRTNMLWVISSGGSMEYTKDFPGKIVQITKKK